MPRFDVIVVGGGPAGAVTARVAAAAGASVLLLERRARIEEPSACAGLVSPRTLSVRGASEACVIRRLRGVTFHAPGGGSLSVRATSDRALVVDRSVLERELLARAAEAGADVRLGTTATGWRDGAVRFNSPGGEETASCAVLVGADGPESQVALWAGLQSTPRGLRAAQAEIELPPQGTDDVHVFVGRQVAPGFFAWSIPAQDGRLRVGLAVGAGLDPGPYLEALLAARFPEGRVVSRVGGAIPLAPGGRIVGDGVLLVGDAAAHVKPLSGGGLYFGGLCARAAGRAAADAAAHDRFAPWRRYQDACRRLIGAETHFGAAARSIRDGLDDEEWDIVLAILDDRDLLALVAERIDLDHLQHMVPHVAGHPRAWRTLFRLLDVVRAHAGDAFASGVLGVARPHDESL
jgi:digeranylgeranylglycerophospholipid reductase